MRRKEDFGILAADLCLDEKIISVGVDVAVVSEFFEDSEHLPEGHPFLAWPVAGNQGFEYVGNGHHAGLPAHFSR